MTNVSEIKKGDKFILRGWHYVAYGDAVRDKRVLDNGHKVDDVRIDAGRLRNNMGTNYELASVLERFDTEVEITFRKYQIIPKRDEESCGGMV